MIRGIYSANLEIGSALALYPISTYRTQSRGHLVPERAFHTMFPGGVFPHWEVTTAGPGTRGGHGRIIICYCTEIKFLFLYALQVLWIRGKHYPSIRARDRAFLGNSR
jgi:hypothetical protein